MCTLKLPIVLIVLSVALNHLEAIPIGRLIQCLVDLSDGTSDRQEWIVPALSRNMLWEFTEAKLEQQAGKTKSHQVEKRKCNTATCMMQRLANFLVRSSNNFGAVLSPTNVGSNTYGKRNTVDVLNTEPWNYLPL